jgi:ABC-type uncharacterized transport system YnjBCD ATPase subunit
VCIVLLRLQEHLGFERHKINESVLFEFHMQIGILFQDHSLYFTLSSAACLLLFPEIAAVAE